MQIHQTPLALGVLATALLMGPAAAAQCPGADASEPNDSCATATVVTPGLYSNLSLDGTLAAGGSNDDYFVVTVPAGEIILVTCLHDAGAGNIDIGLYDAASGSCGTGSGYLATHFVVLDDEEVSWWNNTGVSVDVAIQLTYSIIDASFACNDYALQVDVFPEPCIASIDDSFEPNDDCASNVVITPGSYNDLFVSTTDEDFYRVTLNPTDQIVITATYPSVLTELSIEIYDDPACTTLVTSQAWGGGWLEANANNPTAGPKDYFIRVNPITTGTANCNIYDLDVVLQPDPCLTATDDAFEPNDDCTAAVTLTPGLTSGLFVSATDEDFFKISVPNTDQVVIDQTWVQTLFGANVQMKLYSDSSCTTEVDSGAWGAGNNQVVYGNDTGATTDFYLQVLMQDGPCQTYDLNVTLQPDPCILAADDGFEPNDDCLSAVPLTAGSHTGLFVRSADLDWYSVTIPAGQVLTIDQTYVPAFEMGIDRYNDNFTCGPWADMQSSNGGGLNTQVFPNTVGAPLTIYFQVYMVNGDCQNYDLNVSFAPDPCQLTPDDSFEPNDVCGSGVSLPLGSSTGLFVAEHDLDHYEISVPAGQVLSIDQSYVGGSTELGITLFDDVACTMWLSGASWGAGLNSVDWTNTSPVAHTVYIRCETQIGTGYCLNYDLNVALTPDPCQQPGVDDFLEENDDCGSATVLSVNGESWVDLFVSKNDPDFFTVSLPPGASMQVDATFLFAECDIDMFLYDEASIGLGGCGDNSSYLLAANFIGDNESFNWTNSTGSTTTYYIKVAPWDEVTNASCGLYDLDVTFGGSAYAQPFCFGDDAGAVPCPCGNPSVVGSGEGCINSQGQGAIITATGSNSIVTDDMGFTLTQARSLQTAMLVQGTVESGVPFKDGVLCMGNPTERVEVVFIDASGMASTSGSIVTNGNIPAPGIMRFYQFWYRDPGGISPCGSGSNFSNGLRVLWSN